MKTFGLMPVVAAVAVFGWAPQSNAQIEVPAPPDGDVGVPPLMEYVCPGVGPGKDVWVCTGEGAHPPGNECGFEGNPENGITRKGLPITVYLAEGIEDANGIINGSAPTILWGHGFGATRKDRPNDVIGEAEFTRFQPYGVEYACEARLAGYNVVTMDFRGSGDARCKPPLDSNPHADGCRARFHQPDAEIEDIGHIVDWIEQKSWALQNAEGVVLGAAGGSYGGAWQLLFAGVDDRLDAIAAEITWNDFLRSLAPEEAIKREYVEIMSGIAGARVDVHPVITEGIANAVADNEFPEDGDPNHDNLRDFLRKSSPASYPGTVKVPTLLIQGMPDLAFPLNEAVHNRRLILVGSHNSPVPVKLVTHLWGHRLPSQPDPLGPIGRNICGDTIEQALNWFDHHLRDVTDPGHDTTTGEPLNMALDNWSCLRGHRAEALLDEPADWYGLSDTDVPQNEASSTTIPLTSIEAPATGRLIVGGIPKLKGQWTLADQVEEGPAVAYVSLWRKPVAGVSYRINDQVAPVRVDQGTSGSFEVELGGIATCLAPGDELFVEVESTNTLYHTAAHQGFYPAGTLELSDLELKLATVASGTCAGRTVFVGQLKDRTITPVWRRHRAERDCKSLKHLQQSVEQRRTGLSQQSVAAYQAWSTVEAAIEERDSVWARWQKGDKQIDRAWNQARQDYSKAAKKACKALQQQVRDAGLVWSAMRDGVESAAGSWGKLNQERRASEEQIRRSIRKKTGKDSGAWPYASEAVGGLVEAVVITLDNEVTKMSRQRWGILDDQGVATDKLCRQLDMGIDLGDHAWSVLQSEGPEGAEDARSAMIKAQFAAGTGWENIQSGLTGIGVALAALQNENEILIETACSALGEATAVAEEEWRRFLDEKG